MLHASASSRAGIRTIRFYVDAILRNTCLNYTCTAPSGQYEPGPHTYYAQAEDYEGAIGTSRVGIFTVASVQTPVMNAAILSYSPASATTVTVGQEVTLSVTFQNNGNTFWQFRAGATVWDAGGNQVANYGPQLLSTALPPGQQTTISWSHSVTLAGDYWLQFGVWKDSGTLLDRKPSPSQKLIVGRQPGMRKVILIQGIDSESVNPNCTQVGFVENAANRVGWIVTGLKGSVPTLASDDDFFYFSYSGEYCQKDGGKDYRKPFYTMTDTCNGVTFAAAKLERMVDELVIAYPQARFDILAHSMGGMVAAKWIQLYPGRVSLVNSVVTFDSPLRGLPKRNPRSKCDELEVGSWSDLLCEDPVLLVKCSPKVLEIAYVGSLVPFFTIDATQQDLGVEYVPGDRTTLRNSDSRLHCKFDDDHESVWVRMETSGDAVDCWVRKNPPSGPDYEIPSPPSNVKMRFLGCALAEPTKPENCQGKLR